MSAKTSAEVVYCVVSVVGAILQRGIPVLSWEMVSEVPGGGFFIGGKGGFLNAIVGSLYIVGGSTILGLLIALPVVFYLNVYLKPTSRYAAVARLAFDALFGIPSIVYGAFAFTLMVAVAMAGAICRSTMPMVSMRVEPRLYDDSSSPCGMFLATSSMLRMSMGTIMMVTTTIPPKSDARMPTATISVKAKAP